MLSPAERSNFLRQCWRTRHWKDGVGTLLLPLRMSLYQLRREVARSTSKPRSVAPQMAETAIVEPSFCETVHPIFCELGDIDASRLFVAPLFAEVNAQLEGTWRLAGGRRAAFNAATIESREDVEDVHAYHRLYWALRYAEAAAFGHSRAAEALVSGLAQWLNSKDSESPVASWPYTVAERIASLSAILVWIQQSKNDALFALIVPVKSQIWKDALRLSSTVEFGLGVHNHLLNDARGLFMASAALGNECSEAASWRDRAWQLWDEYFPQLVLEDGTFAEQSSHYHLLLSRTALEYWLSCRNGNHTLPDGFESRIRLMFDLANELLREDGSLPRFGDNSPDRIISDLWGLLAAAHFYGLLKNPPAHSAVTPLTVFYCGTVPKFSPAKRSASLKLFSKGGFAILRSEPSGVELAAHGDTREAIGPHGDAGRGTYEIWWNGDVLIREPGSFFSSSDPRWETFQCAEAQNVTSLDGLSPAITKPDRRFLASWYRPQAGTWHALPGNAVEYRSEAFTRIDPRIVLVRKWTFQDDGALVLEERIEGTTCVRFESRICLGDAPWSSLQFDSANNATLTWQGAAGDSEMIVSLPKNFSLLDQPAAFLPEYGVEKAGRVLILSGTQQLPISWNVRWNFRKAS